jgi:3-hydroxymyristoyl/3-hydroxydecanoyl-(acyl carrier protein) dehydratase
MSVKKHCKMLSRTPQDIEIPTICQVLPLSQVAEVDATLQCQGYTSRSMPFDLVDRVLEQVDDRIVTLKKVLPTEEYLADHFPSFPIMPGVLMLEAMVQAAIRLCSGSGERLVLGEVKAVKYGAMVKPNDSLKVEINVVSTNADGSVTCKGTGTVLRDGTDETETAVAGRFTIRPVRSSKQ